MTNKTIKTTTEPSIRVHLRYLPMLLGAQTDGLGNTCAINYQQMTLLAFQSLQSPKRPKPILKLQQTHHCPVCLWVRPCRPGSDGKVSLGSINTNMSLLIFIMTVAVPTILVQAAPMLPSRHMGHPGRGLPRPELVIKQLGCLVDRAGRRTRLRAAGDSSSIGSSNS